jgi:hypothetical protein
LAVTTLILTQAVFSASCFVKQDLNTRNRNFILRREYRDRCDVYMGERLFVVLPLRTIVYSVILLPEACTKWIQPSAGPCLLFNLVACL